MDFEFDKKFDENEDISSALDIKRAQRPSLKLKRVNVDFPEWMIHFLDHEARHLGVSRQSVIKTVIGEYLHRAKTLDGIGSAH